MLSIVRFTYVLGWITAVLAFALRVVNFFTQRPIEKLLNFEPKTMLEVSGLLFIISIASAAYARIAMPQQTQHPTSRAA